MKVIFKKRMLRSRKTQHECGGPNPMGGLLRLFRKGKTESHVSISTVRSMFPIPQPYKKAAHGSAATACFSWAAPA